MSRRSFTTLAKMYVDNLSASLDLWNNRYRSQPDHRLSRAAGRRRDRDHHLLCDARFYAADLNGSRAAVPRCRSRSQITKSIFIASRAASGWPSARTSRRIEDLIKEAGIEYFHFRHARHPLRRSAAKIRRPCTGRLSERHGGFCPRRRDKPAGLVGRDRLSGQRSLPRILPRHRLGRPDYEYLKPHLHSDRRTPPPRAEISPHHWPRRAAKSQSSRICRR